MSTIALPITGGCLCGGIRFEIDARPVERYYCHCTICRRLSGAPVTAAATFPYDSFAFTSGDPRFFRTTFHYERMACASCGSLLGGRQVRDKPNLVSIRVGSLDEPDEFAPNVHIYTGTRLSWLYIDDDLPRFPEDDPESAKRRTR